MSRGLKVGVGLVVLLVLGAGYLGAAHLSGGALPTPGLELGGDEGAVRRQALRFLEDLQYKDFDKAATYHAPGKRSGVDIPFLLERMFLQKPELIDILTYEIVSASLDEGGDRARLRVRVTVEDLVREKAVTRQFMLFFHREGPGEPWYMELESSLRAPVAEKKK